jgi:hypothetical protein
MLLPAAASTLLPSQQQLGFVEVEGFDKLNRSTEGKEGQHLSSCGCCCWG